MRVISGKYKSLYLEGSKLKDTRPTMDRVKEAIFSMIQNNIKDSICLDIFAGSGALGIEALSNGAIKCYFVDKDKEAIKTIGKNLLNLKVEEAYEIINNDYLKALKEFKNMNITFDIIFIDPPYKLNIIPDILNYISNNNLLNNKGIVICEYTDYILDEKYQQLILIKDKKYGIVKIKIYELIN